MAFKEQKFGHYAKRIDYTKVSGDLPLPNLIEIQTETYKWFIEEGIQQVFDEVFPITGRDGNVTLTLDKWWMDEPKRDKYQARDESKILEKPINAALSLSVTVQNYVIEKGIIQDETQLIVQKIKSGLESDARVNLLKMENNIYFFELKVIGDETANIEAVVKERNEDSIIVDFGIYKTGDVFFGEFPWMTDKGTFIINGSEKVVVSQLVRSPGAYYKIDLNRKNGENNYYVDLIPSRGTWLEFESDSKKTKKEKSEVNDYVFYVKIDKSRKVSVTTLFTALGLSKKEIERIYDNNPLIGNTYDLDGLIEGEVNPEAAIQEIYKKIRSGEVATTDGATKFLFGLLFDRRKYDLTKAGRFKLIKKLSIENRVYNRVLAEDVCDVDGNVVFPEGTLMSKDKVIAFRELLQKGACQQKISFNGEIETTNIIQKLRVYADNDLRERVSTLIGISPNEKAEHVTVPDIVATFSYLLNLIDGIGEVDDIDHLGNRRVRTIGELLQNQFRIGLLRIEKNVKEKMSTSNPFKMRPSNIINNKPLTAIIGEFFNLSQLSQFMDQTNPLAELTNKRRLTALGPGGLSRERAGLEVRDVHYSHYGRICPIETPEGPNIGLINNLSTYAKINEYGFIETPYRRVKDNRVLQESKYLTADEEKNYVVAQANIRLSNTGEILDDEVVARFQGENIMASREEVDFVDVSPKQIVSIATSCIPFLENDDANRALMGANMQRQAIPLVDPQSPYVGTGVEYAAARDSGLAVVAKESGIVEYVDAKRIIIKSENGSVHEYILDSFLRSNQGTSLTHSVLVKKGQDVEENQVLADGPSMQNGELALGQNVVVAFTTWNGYNYEDAIIVSERLVAEDVFTSIHIEEYTIERRKTKQGVEEITREIPNISESSRKFLDKDGLVIIGTEVQPGDILVGKVTPKGQGQQTPEDKLLQAIFGEKSRNVKDNSLRVPNGGEGIVQNIKRFTAENYDLPNDVKEIIKVYIVQKRKIQEGDKMAGRHGNKGVISKVLPVEDMPHLEDGTPVDIMLNPLGVPSRMNIGQVLEIHLGMAAKKLGFKVSTPVFDGLTNDELIEIMDRAGMKNFGKEILIDGRTGEAFDNPISVGVMYMLKLSHMVDDKLHARNVGPYSLITQQPLGGKAQNGGQRFGEMEVWALEAYGAAYTLREILTIKSDDIKGRTKTYEAIVRDKPIPEPGIPESFNVLTKEIQGLGFNMLMIDHEGNAKNINAYDEDEEPGSYPASDNLNGYDEFANEDDNEANELLIDELLDDLTENMLHNDDVKDDKEA